MKEKKKKVIKLATAVLTLATGLTMLVACSQTKKEVDPSKNNPNENPNPPITATEIKVIDILNDLPAYRNLDLSSEFTKLADEICKEKLTGKKILGYEIKEGNLNIVAKSTNGDISSVSVSLPQETLKYVNMSENARKNLVLEKAGYTSSSKVNEDKKSEIETKFNSAINSIITEIGTGKNGTVVCKNDYALDGETVSLTSVFGDNVLEGSDIRYSTGCFREDKSVLAFEYANGILKEHLYTFNDKNVTAANCVEIIANSHGGVDYTETIKSIILSETYTSPELKQPEQSVSFDSLYKEVFGENYTLPTFEELMQNTVPKLANLAETNALFTGFENNDFHVYYDGVSSIGRAGLMKARYRGSDLDSILEYKDEISPILGKTFETNLKTVLGISDNIDVNEISTIKEKLQTYKTNAESIVNIINAIQKPDFQSSTVFGKTNEISDYKEFAQKLFPDKEIIYAGVSDLGGRSIGNTFGTGYYEAFDVLSVYKEDEKIIVDIQEIFVPWYTNSTDQSLYNSMLNDKYKSVKDETTELTNAEELQRLPEYETRATTSAECEITGIDILAEDEEERNRLNNLVLEAFENSIVK